MTITDSAYTPLRQRVDSSELVILAKVAATFDQGLRIERGHEPRPYQILVEDGYLNAEIDLGTARSYSRFRLTAAGRKALALKTADH